MGSITGQGRALPPGWRWVKLGEVVAEALPGFACGERDPKGVVQLRMNNVDRRGRILLEEFLRVPADEEMAARYRLASGDVMFNNTNSTELVGKTALFTGFSEPVVFSNHFTRLRAAEGLEPAFLAWWLLQQWQRKVFESICNRWVGQSAVKNDKLLGLVLPLPPLPEQRRIAGILNEQMQEVEKARKTTEAQLEAARALPAAYLRGVFDSEEAKKWPRKKLKDIALVDLDNGVFKHRHEFGSGTPIVNVSDLYGALSVDWSQTERVTVTGSEMQRYSLHIGDLLFCRSSLKREGVGWCCYMGTLPEPAVFDCHIIRVRPDPVQAWPEFVAHYWRHSPTRETVIGAAHTATMTTINQGDLGAVTVPSPPMKRQKETAAWLSAKSADAGALCQRLRDRIEAVNKLPAALLRKAFNGET